MISSVPQSVYADEQHVPIRVEVRDKNYLPLTDGRIGDDYGTGKYERQGQPAAGSVDARHLSPTTRQLSRAPMWSKLWGRGDNEVGRDMLRSVARTASRRTSAQQNRELLEKLASETGGRY